MTSPDPFEAQARDLLKELLGEFHDHKCVTCNGTNGGCINCRRTGFDQTPCRICDKDGIAFKRRNEALAALNQLHESEMRKAVDDALYHVMSANTEGLIDNGELFIKRGPVEQRLIDILGYEKYKAMQEAVDVSLTPQSKEDVHHE